MNTYSISDLNTYVSDKCLRLYQKLITDGQPFALASEGKKFKFKRCFALSYANLLVLTGDGGNVYLLGDGAANGYQLADTVYGNVQPVNDLFMRPYSSSQSCITIGHRNFAHFIWNHLPAFDVVARDKTPLYCQLFDSFGNSSQILGIQAIQVSEERLPDFKSTLYVGGEYLNTSTSGRITRYLEEKMRTIDFPPELSSSDIIYIGVRGETTRELTNEVEFYVQLMRRLSRVNPRCFFYLDGFSFCNSNEKCEKAGTRTREADDRIRQIIVGWGGTRYRVINGLHLMDALAFIRHISFYITHVGTMQHKIAWFFPEKQGVILSGSRYQAATAAWHAAQVADAQQPYHLQDGHVVHHEEGLRDSPFSIRDIEGSIAHIAQMFIGVLPA